MNTRSIGRVALVVVACGCTVPRGPAIGGAGRRGAPGEEHEALARRAYEDGLSLFRETEKRGFDADRCERLAAAFGAQSSARSAYMQGLSASRCGDPEAAAAAFRTAVERDPALCAARVHLGLWKLARGEASAARADFEQAVRRDPRCAEGYVNLGALQREGGELSESKRNVRRALAIDARLLPAFNELALLHLLEAGDDERKLDLAEVVCSQAQKIDAEFAPIYNTWGLIDLRRRRITDAAAKFRRALSLDPGLFAAHMNYGRIALSFRAYDDARVAFESALSLREGSFDALIGLGVALRGLGRIDEAEERYAEARQRDPARPEPDFNLGVLYQDFRSGSRDDMNRARQHFQRFLQKAGAGSDYEDAVAEVTRRCKPQAGRHRGRRTCLVGRLQTIEQYLAATAQ